MTVKSGLKVLAGNAGARPPGTVLAAIDEGFLSPFSQCHHLATARTQRIKRER
jgi:hypothetical protein